MKAPRVRDVEHMPKAIPPLNQSRYGDMACETLYVHKHVRGERIAESEPAARGIEIHEILATYINHLVRVGRSTDLGVFDALVKGPAVTPVKFWRGFRTSTPLTQKQFRQRSSTSSAINTSIPSRIRMMRDEPPNTRERSTLSCYIPSPRLRSTTGRATTRSSTRTHSSRSSTPCC
jgi:hypothetical protein